MRLTISPSAGLAAALFLAAPQAHAVTIEYSVPSIATPTIQSAVDAAAANALAADLHIINLINSSTDINAEVLIASGFTTAHRLLIRPDPVLVVRAAVVSLNGTQDIFHFTSANQRGGATLQDLDIIRPITNDHHLIELDYGFTDVTIERCRIGCTHETSSGTTAWSYISMINPVNDVVRNCILFSVTPGTFDIGVTIKNFANDGSVYLYNNTISDYGHFGIDINDGRAGTVLVLRNNVLANSPDFPATAEPTAFHSAVNDQPLLLSSTNAAFASAARVELVEPLNLSIAGSDLDLIDRFRLGDTADPTTAFKQRHWNLIPLNDPNYLFFHLWPSGVLHDGLEDVGTTLTGAGPSPNDLAVTDDIDRDPRPSGAPPGHTDRGADQVEGVTSAGVGLEPGRGVLLWAAPGRNPSTSVAVQFAAGQAGHLGFEVFDLLGRRLQRSERLVTAGEHGLLAWDGARAGGVYLYRVSLSPGHGAARIVSGRLILLR